ncbi:hypothetical protein PY254_11000 [Rhodanobacter sp. AS-Z3]|uniref:hypothetical protein n=1 Tax=Rhodanobacter sp. AS-Z3 TaxID=3031330 RepID=UPI002479ED54|nr:hypothetical protein [Rhodanobacter sp. AS-Z3]WEN13772.1 hypothetical protein PY254_11000 [Rhodanobacter sp. AS-Z3]
MRSSAPNYILLGVISFVASFGIQALIVSYLLPGPTIEILSNPLELSGTYTYRDAGRSGRMTWINGKKFYCSGGAISYYSCMNDTRGLPQRASVTVQFVNLKTLYGHIPMVMNIKSSDAKIFSQTPIQVMNSWRDENISMFLWFSSIIPFFVVGGTIIYLNRNKTA